MKTMPMQKRSAMPLYLKVEAILRKIFDTCPPKKSRRMDIPEVSIFEDDGMGGYKIKEEMF